MFAAIIGVCVLGSQAPRDSTLLTAYLSPQSDRHVLSVVTLEKEPEPDVAASGAASEPTGAHSTKTIATAGYSLKRRFDVPVKNAADESEEPESHH